jgi:ESCRT-II complex subunit VPS36
MKSAPSSRPVSPDPDPDDDDEYGTQGGDRFIRISFRKGGDKAFYAALKRSLQQKAWILPSHKQRAREGTLIPGSVPNRSGISESSLSVDIFF